MYALHSSARRRPFASSLAGLVVLAAAVSLFLVSEPTAAANDERGSSGRATRGTARVALEQRLLAGINSWRGARSLAPWRRSALLGRAARAHAADMFRRRYFSHISKDGRGPAERVMATGFVGSVLGENIAWTLAVEDPVAWSLQAWSASPEHHRVLHERRYRVVGLGVVCGTPWRAARAERCYLVMDAAG